MADNKTPNQKSNIEQFAQSEGGRGLFELLPSVRSGSLTLLDRLGGGATSGTGSDSSARNEMNSAQDVAGREDKGTMAGILGKLGTKQDHGNADDLGTSKLEGRHPTT